MKILVIDDEPDFRETLAEWLSRQGHQVHDGNGDSETLAALRAGDYDVVILDLVMPKANGLTLVPEIRRACPRTSVIVLSGMADVRVAVEAVKAGAETCLAKPVDFMHLNRELARLQDTHVRELSA